MKILIICLSLFLVSCSQNPPTKEDLAIQKKAQDFFKPIPSTLVDLDKNKDKIALGKKLYNETKLSRSGTISCNSCHKLDNFGVDSLPTSPGHNKITGDRNSPTTFNAALNFKQFWDGRAKNLEEQALGPLTNPIEHGLKDHDEVLAILKREGYQADFQKAYTDGKITIDRVADSIATFERTLMTPSRFDNYLEGDFYALNSEERKGLATFMEVGCIQCHGGQGLGGESFQKLGSVKKYPTEDMGRFKVTKKRRDKFKFKVPLLRNVTKTGPYFHDGSIKTLEEAIKIMGEYQLGKDLSDEQVADIITFLQSTAATPQHL